MILDDRMALIIEMIRLIGESTVNIDPEFRLEMHQGGNEIFHTECF